MANQNIKRKKAFWLNSYAKINLFLDVLEKLENGYHKISTLFSEIDLHDRLKFSLTNNHDIKIMSNIESLNNHDNLIYKIAIFIQAKYSVQCGAEIILEKKIPIAAGLGGGSSNAATTIKGLSRLWNLDIPEIEMHKIAQEFGSDINFFLEGYLATGSNRGEIIKNIYLNLDFDNILLVNPNFPVSSREAYELVKFGDENPNLKLLLETKDAKFCFNKLEEGICIKYPVIQETLSILEKSGAKKAILSGSGPTMIAFFDDQDICKNAQNLINKFNFWSYITSTRRRQINEHHRR